MQTPELKMPGTGFAGLFDSWKPWNRGEESPLVAVVPSWDSDEPGRHGYTCALSPYCLVKTAGGNYSGLSVKPAAAVVDYFKANVLRVASDTLSFSIIVRDNGTALILMQHSQIIGSHWLDIVPVDSLPAGVIGGE
jgi:hypothetical protein